MTSSRFRALAVVAAGALALVACGGDDDDDAAAPTTASATTEEAAPATTAPSATTAPETTAPTTTEPAPTTTVDPGPSDFQVPGPYAPGVRTMTLGDREMEVWYPVDPAAVEGQPTEIFDQLSVFPEALQPLIPPQLQGEIDTGTYRDAPVWDGDGPYPVVVYSHGFGGYRQVATFLTSHLASWGYVTVSVDHLERGIRAQATGTLGGGAANQDVLDVSNALDALAADADLGPLVDLEQVAIAGHSAGAGTAARAALDLEAIDAFVSISGGLPVTTDGGTTGIRGVATDGIAGGTYEFTVDVATESTFTVTADGTTVEIPVADALTTPVPAFGGSFTVFLTADQPVAAGPVSFTVSPPDKPALVMIGELDEVISAARSTSLYEALDGPKWLVNIELGGHNSFTDSCAGIRALGGLQDLVALIGEAQVARAEDGCTDAYVDPVAAQRVLRQYTVAFVRQQFGQPVNADVALGPDAVPDVALADYRAA